LANYELRALATSIAQRVGFPEGIARGLTVFDVSPGTAGTEVAALIQEIRQLADGQKRNHFHKGR